METFVQSKKSKVGLVSSYKLQNYGAVLQSLATVEFLRQRQINVECINYRKDKSLKQIASSLPLLLIRDVRQMKFQTLLKKFLIRFFHKNFQEEFLKRKEKFDSFVEKFFPQSAPIIGFSKLKEVGRLYKAVIIGSDQVWHPINLGTHLNDLSWVSENVPKMAYASSFGVREIPAIQKNATKAYLSRIESISVRESAGKKIVNDLTGRDVPVVCDPTLLFDNAFWMKYVDEKAIYLEPYILCYFLGTNELHRKYAELLRDSTGLKIVSLPHVSSFNECDVKFGDFQNFDVGPSEFLNLIKNAQYVCTDSFHASVFSIIFEKKFIVFNRYKTGNGSKNSRIDTLLNVTHLEERRFNDGCSVDNVKLPIDYSEVSKRLASYREYSVKHFEIALREYVKC